MNNFHVERGVLINSKDIVANPWNPNQTTDRQQEAIAESLQYYGQILEILVRPHPEEANKYQVIDGEHRLQNLPDSVYVNIIYDLPDAEAKKLTIILNETRGDANKVDLAKLLAEIDKDLPETLLRGLPYTPNELGELLSIAAFDWDGEQAFSTESELDSDSVENKSDLVTFYAKITPQVMEKLEGCRDLLEIELSQEPATAWGQVLEAIVWDYLGGG